jgi:hypothetical protein
MAKLYNFARLIGKYSVPCQHITRQPGEYDEDGIWREPQDVARDTKAAILPVPERTLFESGGRYTAADRLIITLAEFPFQSFIVYKGRKYRIEEETDYTEYADFRQYLAKLVDPPGKVVENA